MKIWFQPCFPQLIVGFIAALDTLVLGNERPHETTERARRPDVSQFSSSLCPTRESWLRIPVAVHRNGLRMSSECGLLLELEDVGIFALVSRRSQTT